MTVTVLTEQDLRRCVGLDEEALAAVENAFTWLTEEKAVMPPVMHINVAENNGEYDIKSAYIKGLDSFAVKIACGFYNNHQLGLPTGNGMVVLLSAKVGGCEAIFLDNGYLTDIRTGLAGAFAAKYLAPETVETAGVIGTGAQGRFQIEGLKLVRDFKRLMIYGIAPEEVAAYQRFMTDKLGVEAVIAESAEQVIRESQSVVTTTPSRNPIVKAEWLHPGLHITAMGADGPGKQELETAVLERADILACDRKSQSFMIGELQHAKVSGLFTEASNEAYELGQFTSGQVPGRRSLDQITVCDLSGTGAQDTAIARYAFQKTKGSIPDN